MSRRSRILRGKDAALERWSPEVLAAGASAEPAPPEPDPLLEAAAQAEALREEARAQGHAEGLAAGREQAAAEAQRLHALAESLGEVVEAFQQALAVEVMELAVAVARQVVGQAIAVDPSVVLPVIREAVASLPHGHPSLRLRVHPEVAALVEAGFERTPPAAGDWQVVADASVEPGGCRIETATGELDATLPARWRAVVAALGSDARWVRTGEIDEERTPAGDARAER